MGQNLATTKCLVSQFASLQFSLFRIDHSLNNICKRVCAGGDNNCQTKDFGTATALTTHMMWRGDVPLLEHEFYTFNQQTVYSDRISAGHRPVFYFSRKNVR